MQINFRKGIILFLLMWASFPDANAQFPDDMFRANPAHNMNFPGNDQLQFNLLAWKFPTGASVRSTALTVGPNLYFGSNDGWFYALDKRNGKLIWKTNCGSALSSSPAYSNNVLYILSQQQDMIALQSSTGEILWKKRIGEDKPYGWGFDYYYPSPMIHGDSLVIATADGKLISMNKTNAKQYWSFQARHFFRASPALQSGWVYIGDTEGHFYALDSRSGRLNWTYDITGSPLNNDTIGFDRRAILSSAVIDGNNVVVGGRDGFLYNLDRFTGELKWKFDHKFSWVISSPSILNGEVITGTSDGKFVQSVNLASGQETWRIFGTAPVWSSPLLTGNQVYIGGNDGVLMGIDRKTGKRLPHPFCINSKIFSSPIVSDSLLYFGADDGFLYCLRRSPVQKKEYNRYVYWNNDKAFNFFRNGVDILVKDYLNRLGYAVIDRDKLGALVNEKKNSGIGNIIVFVAQTLPDSFTRSDSANIFQEFLQSGGIAADLGNNAMTLSTDDKGNLIPFQYKRCNAILGLKFAENDLRSMGGYFSCTVTPAGRKVGMKEQWTAGSPVDPHTVDEVWGMDEKGRASSWAKKVGKGYFLQMNIEFAFPEDYHFIDEVIRHVENY